MAKKQEVENLIKSAELYETQGLYRDARKAYLAASELVKSGDNVKDSESILSDLSNKIDALDVTAGHIESAPATQDLPEDVQNLIKNLFSFSEKKDRATKALSEAVTLAKFGQLERAIEELTVLLDNRTVGLVAAKNIIRCHIMMTDYDKAVDAYEQWIAGRKFGRKQLNSIHRLLENLLIKKGIQKPLPKITVESTKKQATGDVVEDKAPEMLDIGSVMIDFDQGPLKGKPVEFDVNFQTGNTVSLLIESREKNLLESLSIGFRLKEVQYRSSVAIFRGSGVVSAKIMVHEGPKQGDYHLDIKVQDH